MKSRLIPWAKAHPLTAMFVMIVLAFTFRHMTDPMWEPYPIEPAQSSPTAAPTTNPVTLQRAVYQFNQQYPNNAIMLGMKRSTTDSEDVVIIIDNGQWKSMNHTQRRFWLDRMDRDWVNACSNVKLVHCLDRVGMTFTELLD